MKKSAFLSILCLSLLVACSKSDRDLTTTFEKSNYLETDSYDGTVAYAKLLDKQFREVHYQSIGQTAQGRDVPLLIVDKNGYTSPKKIRRSGKNIILVESCIHPGEPNGKDAMFRGMDLEEAATTIERNHQVGGHKE